MSAATTARETGMPAAVLDWFRPTDGEVTAVGAAPASWHQDRDPDAYQAGIQATRAWIERTCPSWCTREHACDFEPPTLACVHWGLRETVPLIDWPQPATVDVSLVVDFETAGAAHVQAPLIHLDCSADAPQRPDTMRTIARLLDQAVALCDKIERGSWTVNLSDD